MVIFKKFFLSNYRWKNTIKKNKNNFFWME